MEQAMNAFWKTVLGVSAVCVLAGLLAFGPTAASGEDDDGGSKIEGLAKLVKSLKVTLGAAVDTAVKKTGGTALEADIEIEDGKPVFEVKLFVGGDKPHVVEIDVDAVTGKILEDDNEGDDDGGIGDDDEDDDD